jgi:aminocarboxymuconate-semialdehyde decarboxylase
MYWRSSPPLRHPGPIGSRVFVADCHTHAVPDGYLRLLESNVDTFGVRVHRVDGRATSFDIVRPGGYFRGEAIQLRDAHWSLDVRRQHMAEVEVDLQLLSPPTYVFGYDLAPAASVENAHGFNDALSSWIEHEHEFLGLGCVPLQHPDHAVGELERLMALPKLVGVTVGTRIGTTELDDPSLESFWETAAALGAIVFVHPSTVSDPDRHEAYYLTHSIGLPSETGLGLARLVLGGVLHRHPRLRVVAAHGGGSFPYLFPRLAHIASSVAGADGALGAAEVQASAERLLYDTVVHGESLAHLVAVSGADRVLLGSDYPAGTGIARPLDALRAIRGLDGTALAAAAGGNLQRLV